VVAFGTLASTTPALAGEFAAAVSAKESVTGPRAQDHATGWAKAVGAQRNVVGTQVAELGRYGFLAQAR
jgi:hypothetical protein